MRLAVAALVVLVTAPAYATDHPCVEPVYPWSDTYIDAVTGKLVTLPGRQPMPNPAPIPWPTPTTANPKAK